MEQVIASRYRIEAIIGTGGMAKVYKALDTKTNEYVAIKEINAVFVQSAMLERFRREGQTLLELNHPNIVKMLDAVEEQGRYYLIMEYVSGGDLRDLLLLGELPISQILQLAIDLADALTRAHRLDIIHRDLKPANILIAEDGTLKLSDFGIALIANDETVTSPDAIVGTIEYIPPELFHKGIVDHRADIWAFGIVLFEMLTGQKPFAGEHMTQVIYNIVTEEVPDLEYLRKDAPIALVDLVYRMLEKDPMVRIPSVRRIGTELEDILEGRVTKSSRENRFGTSDTGKHRQARHQLPQQSIAFVGREVELAELEKLLSEPNLRLLSIVAPGGMGKTRLALELAERVLKTEDFADDVFFVELAPISETTNIVHTIGETLAYQFKQDGRTELQQILDFLADKNLLLILDNCEHLLDGISIVKDILQVAPDVKILATSRERLNLTSEHLFTLSGLDYPEWESPEDALLCASVQLFMNSAGRTQPSFELENHDLVHLAKICRLLAGMPLAIVLAAVWIESLSVQEIAEELSGSIDILETDLRDIPEKQRSIQAVFDYAWNALNKKEQDIFMKLAVFRGSFTRQAGQEIAGASLRQLNALVNKSLLGRNNETGRYFVHELLRQYAETALKQRDFSQRMYEAHSQYYLDFMARLEANIKGFGQLDALNTIEIEFENIRAGWEWARQKGNYSLIEGAVESLIWFCHIRTRKLEAYNLIGAVLKDISNQSEFAAIWAKLVFKQAFIEAYTMLAKNKNLEKALSILQAAQDVETLAFSELIFAVITYYHERDYQKAIGHYQKALAYYQAEDNKFYTGWTLHRLGYCHAYLGMVQVAIDFTEQSLAVRKQIGDESGITHCIANLGALNVCVDNYEQTLQYTHEALDIAKHLNFPAYIAFSTHMLAWTYFLGADFQAAETYALSSEQISQEFRYIDGFGYSSIVLGMLACMDTDYVEGERLGKLGMQFVLQNNPALAHMAYLGLSISLAGLERFDEAKHYLNISLIDPLMMNTIPNFGICCAVKALSFAHEGNFKQAVIGLSYVLNADYTMFKWLKMWSLLDDLKETLLSKIEESEFDELWQQGQALSLEHAIEYLKS